MFTVHDSYVSAGMCGRHVSLRVVR